MSKPWKPTPRQTRFIELYLIYLNATKAYQEAYGVSERVASAAGARLLADVRIAAIIAGSVQERAKAAGMEADEVLNRIAHLGRVDILDAYDERNCLKAIKDIPEEIRLSIAGIETEEIWEGKGADRVLVGYTKKVKFWDKKGSLELLGKHHKLFTDKVEHTADESLASILAAARKP